MDRDGQQPSESVEGLGTRRAREALERLASGLEDPLPHLVAGRYELGDLLGTGATGSVHRARDLLTGEVVAVKLLPPLFENDLVRLRSEIAALRLLRLPGVVHLFDEGVQDGRPFLAMELVEGQPFPGDLPPGATRWTWDLLRDRALALLDVLARVHAAGLVHRDLKPRNVLVTSAGRPVLLDFGLSVGRALSVDSAASSQALGTPAYAAPEQVRGEAVDARSDLYALGVMLWEALAGRRPHDGLAVADIVEARLGRPAEPLAHAAPGVPPEVAAEIDALLAVQRELRPRSAVDVAERLRGGADTGRVLGQLLLVGREEALQRLMQAVQAGQSACVTGASGSGRTRLLRDVAAQLEAQGRRVAWAHPSSRPFDSLTVLAAWVERHEPGSLSQARALTSSALQSALAAGLVLLVDDIEQVDQWSREVLVERGPSGSIIAAALQAAAFPASAVVVDLCALAVADLQGLFEGDDRLLHVHEDAARELWERTAGIPASVQAELDAWSRAGLVEPAGNRLLIERGAVDRLRGGLHVLPVAPASPGLQRPLDDDVDELLAWIHLAWPNTDLPLLVRVTARAAWLLEAELQTLEVAGAVRLLPGGRARPIRPSRRLADATWVDEARRSAHASLGAALASGATGRLYHLVAAGQHEAVALEAMVVARAHSESGRLGYAEAALAQGLLAARQLAGPRTRQLERGILREWLPVALGEITPVAADRLLYELSRCGERDAEVVHIERLVRAAVAAYESEGLRALEAATAVPPLGDETMQRWRHAIRVRAARRCPMDVEERVVEEACAWAAAARGREVGSSRDEWLGRLRYRQHRFREAVTLLARSAEQARRATQKLSALLNAASALLEVPALDEAEALARRAGELAAECRLSYFEGRAQWLVRAVAYRRGTDLPPDPGLVLALDRVGAADLAALAALNEAAFAWRRHDAQASVELAGHAVRNWVGSGHREGFLLSRSLQLAAAGTAPSAAEGRRLEREALETALPATGLQALALLALAGWPVPPDADRLIRAALPGGEPVDPERRHEVLTLGEALRTLRAGSHPPRRT